MSCEESSSIRELISSSKNNGMGKKKKKKPVKYLSRKDYFEYMKTKPLTRKETPPKPMTEEEAKERLLTKIYEVKQSLHFAAQQQSGALNASTPTNTSTVHSSLYPSPTKPVSNLNTSAATAKVNPVKNNKSFVISANKKRLRRTDSSPARDTPPITYPPGMKVTIRDYLKHRKFGFDNANQSLGPSTSSKHPVKLQNPLSPRAKSHRRRSSTANELISKSIKYLQSSSRKKMLNRNDLAEYGRKRTCLFFNRFGKCKRGSACLFEHDRSNVKLCQRRIPTCIFYLQDSCTRDLCPYLHVDLPDDAESCQSFAQFQFCELAEKCPKKHLRKSQQQQQHTSTTSTDRRTHLPNTSSTAHNSSPQPSKSGSQQIKGQQQSSSSSKKNEGPDCVTNLTSGGYRYFYMNYYKKAGEDNFLSDQTRLRSPHNKKKEGACSNASRRDGEVHDSPSSSSSSSDSEGEEEEESDDESDFHEELPSFIQL